MPTNTLNAIPQFCCSLYDLDSQLSLPSKLHLGPYLLPLLATDYLKSCEPGFCPYLPKSLFKGPSDTKDKHKNILKQHERHSASPSLPQNGVFSVFVWHLVEEELADQKGRLCE